MSDNQDKFLTDVRDVLDQSVARMDDDLEQRLGKMKYRAQETPVKSTKYFYRWSSVTVAAIIAVITFISWPQQNAVTDIDLVTLEIVDEVESFEFFQHDMEFYQWLSEEMQNENIPTSSHRSPGVVPGPAIWGQRSGENGQHINAEYRAESGTDRVVRGVQG